METIPQATQEPTQIPRKKKDNKSPEGRKAISDVQKNSSRSKVVGAVGVILPTAPTSPQELVSAWGVTAQEAESHGVLVFRQTPGTDERQLMDRVPMLEYSMDQVACKFGPGTYYIKGTAGRYEARAARFVISPEYAAERGFGRLPEPPKAADLVAVRTLQRTAETAGIDPTELISALERAVEAGLDRRLGPGRIQQHQGPAPFDQMETQFAQVEKMYSFMEKMEARAMESVSRRLGMEPKEEGPDPNSWAGIAATLLPVGMELFSKMMTRPTAQPQPSPEAPPVNVTPLQPQPPPAPKNIKAPAVMEKMTEDEKIAIFPALGMLRPFLGALSKMSEGTRTEPEIAQELEGYIPDNMAPAMVALADLSKRHGVEALALLGPNFQSGRWLTILGELEKILVAKYGEESEA